MSSRWAKDDTIRLMGVSSPSSISKGLPDLSNCVMIDVPRLPNGACGCGGAGACCIGPGAPVRGPGGAIVGGKAGDGTALKAAALGGGTKGGMTS